MNIVFDLGGVIVRWDPDSIIAKIFSDPILQANIRAQVFEHADWLELDRGTLSRQAAIRRAVQRTGVSVDRMTALMDEVPLSLVPFPEMVNLLMRLKNRGIRLYCLSNMHTASIEHIETANSFMDIFEGAVISCRVHWIKPEREIYQHLLHTFDLKAKETLFIDDSDINLEAARHIGIQTIKFENPAQCQDSFAACGYL
ncbi:MAG: HAD family phosphatase [Desulfobacterales bacterium]|nr:HAD family phosphatase [Desulfobacterales bacterium]